MRVSIIGGSGFIGTELCAALLRRGTLRDSAGAERRVESVVLFDAAPPPAAPSDPRVRVVVGDVTRAEDCAAAVRGAGAVVHLAGVMSGTGEKDFDLAMRVNLDGTRRVIDACRALDSPPKFVFASTGAVFGETRDNPPTDDTKIVPLNTYGVTKACCELIVNDATRRGFVDGRSARLPTVIVRPGKPNAATTSCYSGVIREPLSGVACALPVGMDVPHAVTSTRTVVANLVSLLDAPASAFGTRVDRAFNLPARPVTLRALVGALHSVVAAEDRGRLGRITEELDPLLSRTVANMAARDFDWSRARALGLDPVPPVEEVVRQYVDDFGAAAGVKIRLTPRAKL